MPLPDARPDAPPPRHDHRRRDGGRGGAVHGVAGVHHARSGSTTSPASTCSRSPSELGYAPNPAAQALESGRTNTVALLVPDITNPYFSGVIKGAERAAAAAGLTLRARRHPGEPGRSRSS